MKNVFIDFEKWGDSQASVCEVAMIKYDGKDKVDELCSLINPQCDANIWARKNLTSRISASELANAPTITELWDKMVGFVKDCILVCHNVSADINYIYNIEKTYDLPHLYENGYIDTKEIGENVYHKGDLQELINETTGLIRNKVHNAKDDAEMCAELFFAMQKKINIMQWLHTETYVSYSDCKKENTNRFSPTKNEDLIFNDEVLTDNFSFEGKKFCISGLENEAKKKELEAIITAIGGKKGGVTKGLNYIITNDNGKLGPKKGKQAVLFQQEEQTGLIALHESAVRNWIKRNNIQ